MSEFDDLKPTSHLLDHEQLQMLLEAGRDESSSLLDEIFGLFESESVEKLKELHQYKTEGDFEMLGKSAHALSGSSANIGGRELARIAKEIENLCKNQHDEEAARLVDQIDALYRETIIALKRYSNR